LTEMKKLKTNREKKKHTSQSTAARIIEEIAKSERIIHAIAEGITIIDSTFKVIFENQAHKDMMGDHVGEYCYKAYQREEGICGGCPVALTFKDGKVHTVQRALQTDKETRYFEIISSPLKDSTGEVIATVEVVRDSTERHQMEAMLRFNEERYRSTVDFLDDAIHVADENLRILLINKKLLEWHKRFGLEIDVIGKNVFEVYHFLPNKVQAEYESVFQTGSPIKTEESLLIDEDKIITETKKIPIFEDGKVTKVITIIHDITERKHFEEALRESEKRFKDIFDNASDGILLADTETKRFYLGNKTICQRLGYDDEEIKTLSIKDIHPEKDFPYVLKQFEKIITREIQLAMDIPMQRKDRSVFYADVNSFPLIIDGKQYIIGIFRDITERKKAEEILKEKERELEIKAKNLEEANIALKVLLRRTDEDKAELEEKVLLNVRDLVIPYLEKLKSSSMDEIQRTFVNILESNLIQIISPFSHRMSSKFLNFSPTEIQVADLLRKGKTSKEIGALLNSSPRSITFHRGNIRKKLGLKNKKANLKSYLLSLK